MAPGAREAQSLANTGRKSVKASQRTTAYQLSCAGNGSYCDGQRCGCLVATARRRGFSESFSPHLRSGVIIQLKMDEIGVQTNRAVLPEVDDGVTGQFNWKWDFPVAVIAQNDDILLPCGTALPLLIACGLRHARGSKGRLSVARCM